MRVSENAAGESAHYPPGVLNFISNPISISADGHSGVFAAAVDNFVPNDHHARQNVYVWRECAGATYACGDAQIYPGCEQCDDGNLVDGDGCDSTCRNTGCGSGVVTAGEECDDGNLVDGDGCDHNCTVTRCGNGVRAGAEACDDGNTADGDGCSATCALELNTLIEGRGAADTDCWHEWRTQPACWGELLR